MTDPDQPVTVTATRRQWQALAAILSGVKMSYVGPGAEALVAFQAIEQALGNPRETPR